MRKTIELSPSEVKDAIRAYAGIGPLLSEVEFSVSLHGDAGSFQPVSGSIRVKIVESRCK